MLYQSFRKVKSSVISRNKTKKLVFVSAILVITLFILGYALFLNGSSDSDLKVSLVTSMGNITIQLRDDMKITTGNFINLVEQGVYDGTIFHRVGENFMIQGGDPTGTGFGDPSIPKIPDEFSSNSSLNKNLRGTIAMANTGSPDTGSSQFFINVVYNSHLDNFHPVFGDIIEGMDVVDSISQVPTDSNMRPLQEILLIKAYISS